MAGPGGGGGKKKPKKPKRPNKPKNAPAYNPPDITTNMPNFMSFPEAPPAAPNFLPNTPGFEAAQGMFNDQMLAAGTAYNTQRNNLGAQYGLQSSRLDTDLGIARDRELANQAGRGVYTSGFSPVLMQQNVSTPFGRQYQDLASATEQGYANLASQYGDTQRQLQENLYDAYLQRANDAYQAEPLGFPIGGYDLPNLPEFSPIYNPTGPPKKPNKGKKKKKMGKK